MIDAKQRAKLMSCSNKIPDIINIGIQGVTPEVIKNTKDNLKAHELIKVKVQKGCELEANEVALILQQECACDIVHVIGSKIVLYKYTDKKNFKHYL